MKTTLKRSAIYVSSFLVLLGCGKQPEPIVHHQEVSVAADAPANLDEFQHVLDTLQEQKGRLPASLADQWDAAKIDVLDAATALQEVAPPDIPEAVTAFSNAWDEVQSVFTEARTHLQKRR